MRRSSCVPSASLMAMAQAPFRSSVKHARDLHVIAKTDLAASIDRGATSRCDTDWAIPHRAVDQNFTAERLGQLDVARQAIIRDGQVLWPQSDDDRLPFVHRGVRRQREPQSFGGLQLVAAVP